MAESVEGGGQADRLTAPALCDALREVAHASRRHAAELLQLFMLEVRHSGLMLGRTIAHAIIAALAMFGLWASLLAAIGVALLDAGWSLATVLLLLAMANALILAGAMRMIHRSLSRMGIEGTRRALGLGASDASQ